MRTILGAALALGALVSATQAQESVKVQAGKRTPIGFFALYSPVECAAMAFPESKIANAPSNGKIEIVTESRVVTGPQCKPFSMPVQMIYYMPKAGFRGQDEAAVDFFYNAFVESPRPVSQRRSYRITVQ